MHLVHSPGKSLPSGEEAHGLSQRPSDVIILSASPVDLVALARAVRREAPPYSICAANPHWFNPKNNLGTWCHDMLPSAKLVIARLIGGYNAWPDGCDLLAEECDEHDVPLLLAAGDDKSGWRELEGLSSLRGAWSERMTQLLEGGHVANHRQLLRLIEAWLKKKPYAPSLFPVAKVPPYLLDKDDKSEHGHILLLSYRAWGLANDTAHLEALKKTVRAHGLSLDTLMIAGLRNAQSRRAIRRLCKVRKPDLVLSCLGFSAGDDLTLETGIPWLQVFASPRSRSAWHEDPRGLHASDLVMNVAMPELDGRIAPQCIAFRNEEEHDPILDCPIRRIVPDRKLIKQSFGLAYRWIKLAKKPPPEKRLACVLANYPSSDGRIANGVGLDTPASVIVWMHHLKTCGFRLDPIPTDGDALIADLLRGPTNQHPERGTSDAQLTLEDYQTSFATLSQEQQDSVIKRWGKPEEDRFFRKTDQSFHLPIKRYKHLCIGIQPTRGWDIHPDDAVHDPILPPTHGYIAFYLWLEHHFAMDALVHFGKHGSLEWLPGKATALSENCWPQWLLKQTPLLYPFIVNDPGEGTQAKRRNGAVIINHLPPMPQRGGDQVRYAELERLLDEYAEAQVIDPRRSPLIAEQILSHAAFLKLDQDFEWKDQHGADQDIKRLDAYMCMLKEHQMRDGLHILGKKFQNSPGEALFLFGRITPDGSSLYSLAKALGCAFDPRSCDTSELYRLPVPPPLKPYLTKTPQPRLRQIISALSDYLIDLLNGQTPVPPEAKDTVDLLLKTLKPKLEASAQEEQQALAKGLDGGFVPPGPAGAPSRGRWDVLPTGRNFFGADPRALPTPSAMKLGRASAELMLKEYVKHHGSYPKSLALSVWGTSTMRTGGDDIAQALACIGAEPEYNPHSGQLTGFRILPASEMTHPRVDVILRVSGFFRDAFPQLMDLFTEVIRQIAMRDEPYDKNPIRDHIVRDCQKLQKSGLDPTDAQILAETRVFSSKPQTYGAGINSLIDSGAWQKRDEIANLFLRWGGYAYGGPDRKGRQAHDVFSSTLKRTEVVVHNQDNREHDILDSDDYYQFAGGLSSAIASLSGKEPSVIHNDHSNPDQPKSAPLREEIMRVLRARATNPKWLQSIMKHGYKGGAEIAATCDYLFAFAATTHAVPHHAFDLAYQSWIEDEEVYTFLKTHNPAALEDILNRLREAWQRNLWHPYSNRVLEDLSAKPASQDERPLPSYKT